MGLFSGSKRSSTTNTTTAQEAGFSEVSGNAIALQGSGNTVSLTDYGALAAASEIASESLRQVELAGSNARSTVGDAVRAVSESARSETENIVIQGARWAAIVGIAVAAAWGLRAFK